MQFYSGGVGWFFVGLAELWLYSDSGLCLFRLSIQPTLSLALMLLPNGSRRHTSKCDSTRHVSDYPPHHTCSLNCWSYSWPRWSAGSSRPSQSLLSSRQSSGCHSDHRCSPVATLHCCLAFWVSKMFSLVVIICRSKIDIGILWSLMITLFWEDHDNCFAFFHYLHHLYYLDELLASGWVRRSLEVWPTAQS